MSVLSEKPKYVIHLPLLLTLVCSQHILHGILKVFWYGAHSNNLDLCSEDVKSVLGETRYVIILDATLLYIAGI